jgi:N-acetylglucosamine kinase-like BadF-type ATPase
MHSSTLVLGLDVGGTSSRAQVSDLSGHTLGHGRAGGGNPNSHPPQKAVEEVTSAARAALADVAPTRVCRVVLGMAGVSAMSDSRVAGLFQDAWSGLGLTCPIRVVSDCEVAFAAGTPAPSGTVVIAGTGAIAARIYDHALAGISGGYGWLLGDEGSAFWLGREAVRAALSALDRDSGRDGLLVSGVLATLIPDPVDVPPALARKKLITAVNSTTPISLAELAPLVTTAAHAHDETARAIVHRAAELLGDTACATRESGDSGPVVLAGGLIAEGNPVGEALREVLTSRCHVTPRAAGPGAAGAAWLAARELLATSPGPRTPEELHSLYREGA